MGTYLKKAAMRGIVPAMLVFMFQLMKHCEKAVICLSLICVGIAYVCITCMAALFYLYIDKRFKKN